MANEGLPTQDAKVLKLGAALRLANITHYTPEGGQYGYSAGKNRAYVVILLGAEQRLNDKTTKKIPDEVDLRAAMRVLGWVAVQVDWVECAQLLMTYRDWPGDARDLTRILLNLEDYGMDHAEVKKLTAEIDWPKASKKEAWEKVYVKFKQMYREAMNLKPVADELPKERKTKKDECPMGGDHEWSDASKNTIVSCHACGKIKKG